MERVLGILSGESPGPLVICVAAIHGNEQIGIHAFRNVYSAIVNHNIPLKGKLVGIAGNLKAIENNVRFLDYDLNRCWTDSMVQSILEDTFQQGAENDEVKELHKLIHEESAGDYTLKVLADLHATSADRGTFVVVPDNVSDHFVVEALQLPIVVGLHQHLKGTLLSYYHDRDFISFAFEGGTIGSQDAYRVHTSGLWEILEKAGCVSHHDHEVEDHYYQELAAAAESFPEKVEITHRHLVERGDGFRMLPGFHNFQPVTKGQLLALDQGGEILAPEDGMIFMPLYQSVGEDGFFIVREVV